MEEPHIFQTGEPLYRVIIAYRYTFKLWLRCISTQVNILPVVRPTKIRRVDIREVLPFLLVKVVEEELR